MIDRITSFAVTAGGSAPSTEMRNVFGFFSQTGLRRDHMTKLVAAADRDRQRAAGAVGRGVGIVAGDQHARLRDAQLGRDDMGDALIAVTPADMRQREFGGVLVEHLDDAADFRIGHAGRAQRSRLMVGR